MLRVGGTGVVGAGVRLSAAQRGLPVAEQLLLEQGREPFLVFDVAPTAGVGGREVELDAGEHPCPVECVCFA